MLSRFVPRLAPHLTPAPRAAVALLLFSGWLALLFTGHAGGGAVHLLLLGALAVFPWKAAASGGQPPSPPSNQALWSKEPS